MGGCYRWDDAAQRWTPLQDAIGVSTYHGIESIASDPRDANVVYAACGMYRGEDAAILRSRDRGATWEVFPVSFRMGGNEDGRGLGERLAIDPGDTRVLYFGSRHDGLQRSTDSGQTWRRVDSFPIKGLGTPTWEQPTHAGLSFVVFHPASAAGAGQTSRTIFIGVAHPAGHRLFRSDDAGETWSPVPGEPNPKFIPAQAQVTDDGGTLYITYVNHIGPNDITDGAVWKLDTKSNAWTDITPDKRPDRPRGGYMGLSLDRQKSGTLAVATIDRWSVGDTVWRSADGGATWAELKRSRRDVSATPFLLWGRPEARLGWWMSALAIDPFDSDHCAYATGATIYATRKFSDMSKPDAPPTPWQPWVGGIEQTAIVTLLSPPQGAHLISGFGDIGGFVHDDLDVSPPQGMCKNPLLTTTTSLDCADGEPGIIVRGGQPNDGQAPLGYSQDGGQSWQPMELPQASGSAADRRRGATPAIVVSADGKTFMVMTRPPMFTRDRGQTWTAVNGLPAACRPVPDRIDANAFYALDFAAAQLYASADGGATFTRVESTGLPSDLAKDAPTWHEAPWPLHTTRGKRGDLWFVSRSGLFHSTNGGRSFERKPDALKPEFLSFGKAPAGSDYPALFATGTLNGLKAVWRSDDAATSWVRVNDDQHQYGTRFRCLSGDPRVFGRVYVGTDGRGILVGEPR